LPVDVGLWGARGISSHNLEKLSLVSGALAQSSSVNKTEDRDVPSHTQRSEVRITKSFELGQAKTVKEAVLDLIEGGKVTGTSVRDGRSKGLHKAQDIGLVASDVLTGAEVTLRPAQDLAPPRSPATEVFDGNGHGHLGVIVDAQVLDHITGTRGTTYLSLTIILALLKILVSDLTGSKVIPCPAP
jgi:hypothetical protein